MKKQANYAFFISAAFLWLLTMPVFAQKIDTSSNRVKTDFKIDFKRIGTVKPKNATEITSSTGFWVAKPLTAI